MGHQNQNVLKKTIHAHATTGTPPNHPFPPHQNSALILAQHATIIPQAAPQKILFQPSFRPMNHSQYSTTSAPLGVGMVTMTLPIQLACHFIQTKILIGTITAT
jgi:hypothetical protein